MEEVCEREDCGPLASEVICATAGIFAALELQ
jgi:hypothetical protein